MLRDDLRISHFTELVTTKTPFIWTRFGDGELIAVIGHLNDTGFTNCDGSRYFPELQTKLTLAYKKLIAEGAYISNGVAYIEAGIPYINPDFDREILADYKLYIPRLLPELADYERNTSVFLLHRRWEIDPEHRSFYEAIRNSDMRKVYIGPPRLEPWVTKMLRCEYVMIPDIDALTALEEIRRLDLKEAMVLVSSGWAAKVFLSEIDAPIRIDVGSGLDPLYCPTRSDQITVGEMREYYKDWLDAP